MDYTIKYITKDFTFVHSNVPRDDVKLSVRDMLDRDMKPGDRIVIMLRDDDREDGCGCDWKESQ